MTKRNPSKLLQYLIRPSIDSLGCQLEAPHDKPGQWPTRRVYAEALADGSWGCYEYIHHPDPIYRTLGLRTVSEIQKAKSRNEAYASLKEYLTRTITQQIDEKTRYQEKTLVQVIDVEDSRVLYSRTVPKRRKAAA